MRHRRYSAVAVVAVVAAALLLGAGALGCGDNEKPQLLEADACSQITVVSCQRLYECPQTAQLAAAIGGNEFVCETGIASTVCGRSTQPLCGGAAGGHYDAASAEACIAALDALTCDQAAKLGSALGGSQAQAASVLVLGSIAPCQQICATASASH